MVRNCANLEGPAKARSSRQKPDMAHRLMLAYCRGIARMDREVRSGTWSTREGVELFGKTLGVIGLGGIGRGLGCG
jgi:phosphoglycerate dehydrogenase-like enzyme